MVRKVLMSKLRIEDGLIDLKSETENHKIILSFLCNDCLFIFQAPLVSSPVSGLCERSTAWSKSIKLRELIQQV